ncbi:hypothetical protein SELMODRAFT_409600 [Selaginella moellendorffii]|uniref:Uncharacterized protein n=1 Tax=Selaginella moellendorffii TaxID=88036 RepID=D8RBY9_SELML|nr:hypothetical protein SELMODRAFT_409600 [Selaginella moellendorffii]
MLTCSTGEGEHIEESGTQCGCAGVVIGHDSKSCGLCPRRSLAEDPNIPAFDTGPSLERRRIPTRNCVNSDEILTPRETIEFLSEDLPLDQAFDQIVPSSPPNYGHVTYHNVCCHVKSCKAGVVIGQSCELCSRRLLSTKCWRIFQPSTNTHLYLHGFDFTL